MIHEACHHFLLVIPNARNRSANVDRDGSLDISLLSCPKLPFKKSGCLVEAPCSVSDKPPNLRCAQRNACLRNNNTCADVEALNARQPRTAHSIRETVMGLVLPDENSELLVRVLLC